LLLGMPTPRSAPVRGETSKEEHLRGKAYGNAGVRKEKNAGGRDHVDGQGNKSGGGRALGTYKLGKKKRREWSQMWKVEHRQPEKNEGKGERV